MLYSWWLLVRAVMRLLYGRWWTANSLLTYSVPLVYGHSKRWVPCAFDLDWHVAKVWSCQVKFFESIGARCAGNCQSARRFPREQHSPVWSHNDYRPTRFFGSQTGARNPPTVSSSVVSFMARLSFLLHCLVMLHQLLNSCNVES